MHNDVKNTNYGLRIYMHLMNVNNGKMAKININDITKVKLSAR